MLNKIYETLKKIEDYFYHQNTKHRPEFLPQYMRKKQAAQEALDYITEFAPHAMLFEHRDEAFEYCLRNYFDVNNENKGLFLEFGVFNGTSINLCSDILKKNHFYGFDSFEGLPENWQGAYTKGMFDLKGKLPKVNKNVTLIKGLFNETLPDFISKHNEDIAFINIDCDIYSSTKIIFDTLGDKIKSGTIIAFDEYLNFPNWKEHEFKAFQEFVKKRNLRYEYLSFAYYQGIVRIL